MYRIAIITAVHSQAFIEKALNKAFPNIDFIYLSYSDTEDALKHYYQHKDYVNGMLFSGELTYYFVKQEISHFSLPVSYLELTQEDFYKTLLPLFNDHQLKLERTCIDFLNNDNDYMGLKDITEPGKFPYIFDDHLFNTLSPTIVDDVVNRHKELYHNGKIDLSITRFSNATKKLKALNIPTVFLFPSSKSIVKQMHTLIADIKGEKLLENQIAVGKLTFSANGPPEDLEIKQLHLHRLILEFAKMKGSSFFVQNNHDHFIIVTTYGELKLITNMLKHAELFDYLQKHTDVTIKIGWGVGGSVEQAQKNADQAKSLQGISGPYIVSETDVYGPLRLAYTPEETDDSQLVHISNHHHISPHHLQRLLYTLEKLSTDHLTSEDLATHLGISTRSANRVLNKFVDQGLAKVKHQSVGRGRPQKVYVIDITKLQG
jgi:hypothetical protein